MRKIQCPTPDHKSRVYRYRALRECSINLVREKKKKKRDHKKLNEKLYRHSMIRKCVYSSIKHSVKKIAMQCSSGVYDIINELKQEKNRNNIIKRAKTTIAIVDNNLSSEKKLNPQNVDLTKQLEFFFRQCLIELIVKIEVKRLKNSNVSNEEIIELLKNDKNRPDKEIRPVIKRTLADLYDNNARKGKIEKEIKQVVDVLALKLENTEYINNVFDFDQDDDAQMEK